MILYTGWEMGAREYFQIFTLLRLFFYQQSKNGRNQKNKNKVNPFRLIQSLSSLSSPSFPLRSI